MLICFTLVSMTTNRLSQQAKWEVPEEFKTLLNPYEKSVDSRNVGRTVYLKNCKSCHGDYGKGDGPMAEDMDVEIADFTKGSIPEQTDGTLYYKFLNGKGEMPAFESKIKREQERWFLVNYIRKLSNGAN